jgi:hypothetical protein
MKFAVALLALIVVGALLGLGCGGSESSTGGAANQARLEHRIAGHQAARHRAALRHRARVLSRRRAARHAHQAAQRKRRAEARQALAEEAEAQEVEEVAPEESECDPNYAGACLSPTASDYDCAGGSGDGPLYTGTVTVIGEDHYGLDADSDGTGCEGE